MKELDCNTYWAKIFIAGPIDVIKQTCRKFVLTGLCVTVTPTTYIYTGGEEVGVIVELINYPRFPTDLREIIESAIRLGEQIMIDAHQVSYTVQTPYNTYYFSRREEIGVR